MRKLESQVGDRRATQPVFDFKYYKDQISNRNANNLLSKYLEYNEIKNAENLKTERTRNDF